MRRLSASFALGVALLPAFAVQAHAVPQKLSLPDAIKLAEERNLQFRGLKLDLDSAKLSFDSSWHSMFLPTLTLSARSDQTWNVGAIPGSAAESDKAVRAARGYPTGNLSLSLGAYTLFNSWKDRINYDLARLGYERSVQRLEEQRRSLKFQVTRSYLVQGAAQRRLEAAERSLQIARTIRDLIKSRVQLGRSASSELESIEVDVNNAKIEVDRLVKELAVTGYTLNQILNVDPDSEFDLVTEIEFKPIPVKLEKLRQIYENQSPEIRDAKYSKISADRALELAERGRIPLPIVNFEGVTVNYTTDYGGRVPSAYSSLSGRPVGALDVSAQMSLTVPLFGPEGFWNWRSVARSQISADRAELGLQATRLNGEIGIRNAIAGLIQLEAQIKSLKGSLDQSLQLLDGVVEGVSKRKFDRLELRDSIATARNNEIDYFQAVATYVNTVNDLIVLVGANAPEDLQ